MDLTGQFIGIATSEEGMRLLLGPPPSFPKDSTRRWDACR